MTEFETRVTQLTFLPKCSPALPEPVAWAAGTECNARGFIDVMAWSEGEFTVPLYTADQLRTAITAAVAEERAVPKPAVRTDTARLDMLESDKMMRVFKIGKTWYWKPAYGMPHRKAKTLREAIDAALGAGCARVAVCACDEQGEPGVTCGDCPSDYGHCVTPSPTPAAEQPKAAVREEALFDAIKDVLLHHRMSYTEGEDAEAFPLVDMLCPPGSRDISKGHDEITLICDAIYNDEAVRAALSGEQQ